MYAWGNPTTLHDSRSASIWLPTTPEMQPPAPQQQPLPSIVGGIDATHVDISDVPVSDVSCRSALNLYATDERLTPSPHDMQGLDPPFAPHLALPDVGILDTHRLAACQHDPNGVSYRTRWHAEGIASALSAEEQSAELRALAEHSRIYSTEPNVAPVSSGTPR